MIILTIIHWYECILIAVAILYLLLDTFIFSKKNYDNPEAIVRHEIINRRICFGFRIAFFILCAIIIVSFFVLMILGVMSIKV